MEAFFTGRAHKLDIFRSCFAKKKFFFMLFLIYFYKTGIGGGCFHAGLYSKESTGYQQLYHRVFGYRETNG